MEICGKCRHFSRTKMSTKDLCGAWEMPTTAKREACGFYIPKVKSKEKRADMIAN